MEIPKIRLKNGQEIPLVGLGTYRTMDRDALEDAIQRGYRMIDTARFYKNEEIVGQAVQESGLERSEIILATKVWPSDFGRDQTKRAIEASLKALQTDYIDLLYLHWWGEKAPQAWKVLEEAMDQKIARTIAVCNFSQKQLEEMKNWANEPPAIDQIELHPLWPETELLAYLKKEGIQPMAYSPIARAKPALFEAPAVVQLAKRYQKTPAQIVLRWHLERGTVVIPKTVSPARQIENLELFDFQLQAEDMEALAGLASPRGRLGHGMEDPQWIAEMAAMES